MSIQWFPGHMYLTQKAITERVKGIDVVIEMLDARLPGSSANPLLGDLTRGIPSLKILNKQDLADPQRTDLWLAHYTRDSTLDAQPSLGAAKTPSAPMHAISLDAADGAPGTRLIQACRALAPGRGSASRPLRVLICGIPNVGKSTLINRIAGKRAAKTGDEAGVTKTEQRIALDVDFYLFDTPGMLWPRIIVEQSGYNLAASGAVGRNAYDDDLVALALVAYLKQHYAHCLKARFGLEVDETTADELVLEGVGRQRGALLSGGRVNMQKAAELLIQEFRSGKLGRITLETPAEFSVWLKEGRRLDAERLARKKALQEQQRSAGHGRRRPAGR